MSGVCVQKEIDNRLAEEERVRNKKKFRKSYGKHMASAALRAATTTISVDVHRRGIMAVSLNTT